MDHFADTSSGIAPPSSLREQGQLQLRNLRSQLAAAKARGDPESQEDAIQKSIDVIWRTQLSPPAPSIPGSSMSPEIRLSGYIYPIELPENIIKVEEAAQMNTLGDLVEAVDDESSRLAHDAQANTKPVRMAPQYDAYVMTLLSLRIELRIWLGRRAPSPTIHISTSGETLLEDSKQRIRWTCVSLLSLPILAGWRLTCLTALRPPFI